MKAKGYAPALKYPNSWEATHNKEKVFKKATTLAGKRLGVHPTEVDPANQILPGEWLKAGVKNRSVMVLDPTILKHEADRARRVKLKQDPVATVLGGSGRERTPASMADDYSYLFQNVPAEDVVF